MLKIEKFENWSSAHRWKDCEIGKSYLFLLEVIMGYYIQ